MSYSGPWRVVKSLTTLRLQLDVAFPERSHASDGTIADDAHTTTSDHYPHQYAALGSTPVVTAFDGTQDPAHGCDNSVITEAIRQSRDARVKYVIWNRQMYSSYVSSSGVPAFTWRPYSGAAQDPHTNHFHISVLPTALADSTAPWAIGVEDMTPDQAAQLAQVHAIVRADRWQWQTDRAGFVAAGGDPNVWDYGGGMGANTEAKLLAGIATALTKVGEQLTIISQKLDTIATGGVTHEALVAAFTDPAVVQAQRQASFEGAQRAEGE